MSCLHVAGQVLWLRSDLENDHDNISEHHDFICGPGQKDCHLQERRAATYEPDSVARKHTARKAAGHEAVCLVFSMMLEKAFVHRQLSEGISSTLLNSST